MSTVRYIPKDVQQVLGTGSAVSAKNLSASQVRIEIYLDTGTRGLNLNLVQLYMYPDTRDRSKFSRTCSTPSTFWCVCVCVCWLLGWLVGWLVG